MANRAMAPRAFLAKKEMIRLSPFFSSRNFGVTTGLWDVVLGTRHRPRPEGSGPGH